jgi:hypothetical protein
MRCGIALTNRNTSRLCGVVISMHATGPNDRGFKPGRGTGFLRAIKIRSTPSFGWEVKAEVTCRKIVRLVKDLLRYFRYWQAKFSFLRPFLLLSPDICGSRTVRELWWTSQELSPLGIIITMAPYAYISPGGWTVCPLVAAVLRHILTPSQSINQSIKQHIIIPLVSRPTLCWFRSKAVLFILL